MDTTPADTGGNDQDDDPDDKPATVVTGRRHQSAGGGAQTHGPRQEGDTKGQTAALEKHKRPNDCNGGRTLNGETKEVEGGKSSQELLPGGT